MRDCWFVVSREGYAGLDSSPSAGWWDKLQFCGFVLRESVKQFGPVGTVLWMIGFVGQWRLWSRHIAWALVLGYVCNTIVLIGLLGFDYELLHRNIFRVYPLIAYVMLSIWMGLGMHILTGILITRWGRKIHVGVAELGVCVLVVGIVLSLNAGINYRGQDDWAEVYARTVLETLEPDAVLFTDGDLDINPLGYFNRVEKIRPDISLYTSKGIVFNNRLFFPGKDSHYERNKKIDAFIKTTKRPVYYTYGLPHIYGVESFGLYQRVDLDMVSSRKRVNAIPEIVEYYKHILASGEPKDPWEIMHYRLLVVDFCNLSLGLLEHSAETGETKVELQDWVNKVCHLYHGYMEYIEVLLNQDNPDMERIESLFNRAEDVQDQVVLKSESAKLKHLRGSMLLKMNKRQEAVWSFQESVNKWSHPDNPSFKQLRELRIVIKE